MKHHTVKLAFRATHIAQREADKVWQRDHDWGKSIDTFLTVYNSVLMEFHGGSND